MKSAIVLFVAILAASAAQAGDVQVTRDPSTVSSCQVLGMVQSSPPYWTLHAALNQVKAQAVSLHADTILLTSSKLNGWFTTATAYRCAK
jgi:hypothetical protein